MGDIEFSFELNYRCEPENKRIMERKQSSGFRRIFTVAYLTLNYILFQLCRAQLKRRHLAAMMIYHSPDQVQTFLLAE